MTWLDSITKLDCGCCRLCVESRGKHSWLCKRKTKEKEGIS